MHRYTTTHRSTPFLLAALLAASVAVAEEAQPYTPRVLDPDGKAVAGATVVLDCGSAGKQRTTTDAEGRAELELPAAADCTLTAGADGFRSRRTGATGEEIRLELAAVEGEILVTSAMPELATERRIPGEEVRDSGSQDLGRFFRGVGGLSAVRRGSINLEPTIRGLQEEQVATFVDGTRTFAAGPARMDSNISHVGTHATQSVRIVKGPYALAWGSGTLSALEIGTRRPSFSTAGFEWNGTVSALYGDNAEALDSHAGVWGSSETFRFYVSGGYREGSDYEAGDGNLVPGDYESTDTRWRFGFRPNESLLVEYSGGYQEQFDLDYPGRLLDATYFYYRGHTLDLTWNGEGNVSEVHAQLYTNHKDHLMNNDEKPTAQPNPGRIPPFGIRVDLPTSSDTDGGRFKVSLGRDALEWTFGLDYYSLEQSATRTISRRSNGFVLFEDIVWPDAEIEDLGGFAQLVYRGGSYQVGATLRLDDVDATADNLSPFYVANTSGSPDQSETHFSAAVSGTVTLDPSWTLSLGLGRAVRTATVLERYSDRFPSTKFQLAAEFMGNPTLDPEESLELNVGARGSYGDFFVEIDTFYREIDGYITVVADPDLPERLPLSPPVVFRYVNGTQATFWGGELLFQHRAGDLVSWRGALAYVRADDEALDEPVLGIAPLRAELGLRFHPLAGRLWVDAAAKFTDRQDRVATSRFEQETPGATVYNLAARYQVGDTWAVTAAVDNLTDHAYADHLNSPNPFSRQRVLEMGRNVRLGFQVDF